ncbi:hypothetical protein DYH09_04600 [bacterium CPR1]|nr:hypothetical protein [bacterium CPR1]
MKTMPRILLIFVGLLCLFGARPAQAQEHRGVHNAAHGTLEVAHPAPLPVGPLAVLLTRERPYPLSRPNVLDPFDPSGRPEVLSRARQLNHRVELGDLSSETILDACGAYRARLAVLTMPDPLASTRVAEILHQARPDLPVLARGVSQEHCRDLREHGVRMALWPEFECGLELTKQGLLSLGLPVNEEVLRTELENDGFGRKDAPLHFEDTLPMDEREQLVTALIQLAWADGRWSPAETSLVRQVLDRVGLSHQEFEQRVIRYRDGSRPKLELLDKGRRINAMRLLLAVAWSDQEVPESEARYLGDMARQLALTDAELQALLVETRGSNEDI